MIGPYTFMTAFSGCLLAVHLGASPLLCVVLFTLFLVADIPVTIIRNRRYRRKIARQEELPPPTRQFFRNNKDELAYLRDQIEYWLVDGDDRTIAMEFADRFETLIILSADSLDGSIVLADYRATLADLRNDTEGSIEYRKQEIKLVETLLEINGSAGFYDWEYVAVSYELVAALSEMAGKLEDGKTARVRASEIKRTRL